MDVKQANGNNARVIIVGLVNLLSLFKQARRFQLTALPTPRPHPSGTTKERLSVQQKPARSKANSNGKTPTKKQKNVTL